MTKDEINKIEIMHDEIKKIDKVVLNNSEYFRSLINISNNPSNNPSINSTQVFIEIDNNL